MANVLIVDDDKLVCDSLSRTVTRLGHSAAYALTLEEGLKYVFSEVFDVVFLDVRLPDGSGLNVLERFTQAPSSPEIIIITGQGDRHGAEVAIKSGAWDYIEKPPAEETLKLPLVRALQYREEKARKPSVALRRKGIIGNSPQIMRCLDAVAQAAISDSAVLITGETGTGKELFARAIHDNSPRANRSFVVVDCATLPETLVESILFGHERGTFTGAITARDGLIKQADGGTLFLDEVGELPPSIQKSFLRVLQEYRFRPVGGKREEESRFRLVVATNRNLDKMVQGNQFRKDLLFRLRSFTIDLPPLRGRIEDIRELATYYMTESCKRYRMQIKGFSSEFFDCLTAYDWPGNVRELVNSMETALALAFCQPTLFPIHLPTPIRVQAAQTLIGANGKASSKPNENPTTAAALPALRDFRADGIAKLEREYLQELLSVARGNIKQASELSRVTPARLYQLLNKHRLSPTSKVIFPIFPSEK